MTLYDILDHNACALDIRDRTKEDALRTMSRLAAKALAGKQISADTIYTRLKQREDQGSTGFGNGIAIPHTRIPGMNDFLLFIVTSRRGVDFQALDKKRVHLFLVLLGPEDRASEHLRILAALSHLLTGTNVKREVLAAQSSETACEVFLRNVRSAEEGGPLKTEKMKLLHVILYVDDFLYDILEFFIEQGIDGATILESSGMGQYISNIPLFASFIGFMNEEKNRSRTIMALVGESRIDDIIKGIEGITGDLDKRDGAMVIVTDVAFHKGSMRMM